MIECYNNRNDFKQTLLNLGIIFLHLIATVRIIHWHFVRNDCKDLLKQLLADNFTFKKFHLEYNFKKTGLNDMKIQKNYKTPNTIEEMEKFRLTTIKFANKQACTLYFAVAFLMFGDILVSYVSVRVINAWQKNTTTKILPYNTYFFFDAQEYYNIAWLYQFLSILFTMYQMGRKLLLSLKKKN